MRVREFLEFLLGVGQDKARKVEIEKNRKVERCHFLWYYSLLFDNLFVFSAERVCKPSQVAAS